MGKYKYKHITGHVQIVEIWNEPDHSGEWDGGGTFLFKLKKPLYFYGLNGMKVDYTHANLKIGSWDDRISFIKPNTKRKIVTVPGNTSLIRDMYEALSLAETGKGKLEDYCFSDDLYDSAFPKPKAKA